MATHSEQTVDALIRRINDGPDELHADVTPAVRALGAMGLDAVGPLLDLLASGDETTRLRAQRALEAILAHRHGFRDGQGFPSAAAEAAMRAEWDANGYDHAADASARAAAVANWRHWLAAARRRP
jgi:hypothetical protein